MGKQVKNSSKPKNVISISRPIQLLHRTFLVLQKLQAKEVKDMHFVGVDDYSLYNYLLSLSSKDEAIGQFSKPCKNIQMKKVLLFLNYE